MKPNIEKLLLPISPVRKGKKAKPSIPHKDKRKKKEKYPKRGLE